MNNDNARVDDMEIYLNVFDLLAEMLKSPDFSPVKLETQRPYGKPNDPSTATMELKLSHDGKPLLLVHLDTAQVGEVLKCNYLLVHVADGELAEQNPAMVRFQKISLPLYHYGDLSFGARFAAAFLAECALLAMKDENMFLSVIGRLAFDRAQDRLVPLYQSTNFPFYPQSVTRKKAEEPA